MPFPHKPDKILNVTKAISEKHWVICNI